MSSIGNISNSTALWNLLNSASSSAETDTETAAKAAVASASGEKTETEADSTAEQGSGKTTVERTVSKAADGSLIVTLTQVTANADGSTSTKVLCRNKISSSQLGGMGAMSSGGGDTTFMSAQAQMLMSGSSKTMESFASSQYEANSLVGDYSTGLSLKVKG